MAKPQGEQPLSQDDIDAALHAAAAGTDEISDEESGHGGGGLPQADVDAAAAAEPQEAGDAPDENTAETPDKVDAAGHPYDETAAMMEAAIAEEKASPVKKASTLPPDAASAPMPDFERKGAGGETQSIDLLRDVDLHVKIELGRSRMLVEEVLKLANGSVVELDKLAGDPVDVLVNEKLVARGEVLVLNDNFCVRINEILSTVEELV